MFYENIKQTIMKEYPKRPQLFGSPEPIMAILDMAIKRNLLCGLSHFTLGVFADRGGKRVYFFNDIKSDRIVVTGDGDERAECDTPDEAFQSGMTMLLGPLDRLAQET